MMRGRKNDDFMSPQYNILPPCRICGEPGNGFHYGVNTCGACKGFFRRSLARKEPYECIHSRLCNVGPKVNRRQSCPKCRYDKCITLGMSKDACKVGRYSLIKKSTYIKEVIEQQSNLPDTNSPMVTNRRVNGSQDSLHQTVNEIPSTSSSFSSPLAKPNQFLDTKVISSFNTPRPRDYSTCPLIHRDNVLGLHKQPDVHPTRGDDGLIVSSSPNILDEYDTSNNYGEEYYLTKMVLRRADDGVETMGNEFNNKMTRQERTPGTTSDRDNDSPLTYTVLESTLNSKTVSLPNCLDTDQTNNSTQSSQIIYKDKDGQSTECYNRHDPSTINSSFISWYDYTQNTRNTIVDQPFRPNFPDAHTSTCIEIPTVNTSTHNLQHKPIKHKPRNISSRIPTSQISSSFHSTANESSTSNYMISNSMTTSQQSTMLASPMSGVTTNQVVACAYRDMYNYDTTLMTHDTPTHVLGIDRSGDSFSTSGKRCSEDLDVENETAVKKYRALNMMEPDSSETNVVTSDSMEDMRLKPLTLYVVDPDPMKYVLSIFEEFPFRSFEKKSLAPLLKLCYNRNEWVNEYFTQSATKVNKILSIEQLPQKPIATPGSMTFAEVVFFKGSRNVTFAEVDFFKESRYMTFAEVALKISCYFCKCQLLEKVLLQMSSSPTPDVHLNSIMAVEHSTNTSEIAHTSSRNAIEMDNLFECIRAVHGRHYDPELGYMTGSEKSMFIEMFHKICRLHESLLGTLNLIDEDKYYEVLKSTGVDVDKRREWFRCAFWGYDEAIARDTKFFRALPGVKNFSLKDRITLTKSTSLVIMGLNENLIFDRDRDVIIDQDRSVALRLSTLLDVTPGFRIICDAWDSVLKSIKDLKISYDELVVFKALLFIFPDFCLDLEDRELVTAWHNVYLNCLLHIVRKSHGPKADDRFNSIVGIIQTLKEIASAGLMRKVQISIKDQIKHLSDGQDQPLLTEVYVNLPFQPSIMTIGDSQGY